MKVFATVVAAVLATMLSLYCFHRRTTSLSVFGRSLHQVEPAFDTRDVHPRSLAAAQASPTNGIRLCCGCKFDFLTVGVFLSQDDQAATLENHCGITVAASKGLSPANMPPPSTANVNVLDTAVQKDPDATPHILHGKALVIQDPSLPEHIPVAHKCGGCLVFQFDTPILPVSVGVIGMNDDLTLTIEVRERTDGPREYSDICQSRRIFGLTICFFLFVSLRVLVRTISFWVHSSRRTISTAAAFG